MEFLTIQIEQISKNYIKIEQIKNVVSDPSFDVIVKDSKLNARKDIKESKTLQSQTIFPINKMVIQTISDVMPENILSNGSFVVSDANSQIEFCAIVLSMMNFNSFALPKYAPNQIAFKNDIEFYHVENEFWFNGEQVTFDKIMNVLLMMSGSANGSSIEWGDLIGNIQNQPDLMSQFNSQQINQINFVLDKRMKYESTIQSNSKSENDGVKAAFIVNCQTLQIDFGSYQFDPLMKYQLLIDRYRQKAMKKNKTFFDSDGNVIGKSQKFRQAQYHHEHPLDAERNQRLNEIEIDMEKLADTKLFPVYMQQENYFNSQSFPHPSGISRKSKTLKIGFRLRITNPNDKTSNETGFIGFIKMLVSRTDPRSKDYTISFKK
jgi:hypothetical protein